MPMFNNGYNKVVEEAGELLEVVGKKLAYFHTDDHPDGKGPLFQRLEEEIGDVIAALTFVIKHDPKLSRAAIESRAEFKLALFEKWHREES